MALHFPPPEFFFPVVSQVVGKVRYFTGNSIITMSCARPLKRVGAGLGCSKCTGFFSVVIFCGRVFLWSACAIAPSLLRLSHSLLSASQSVVTTYPSCAPPLSTSVAQTRNTCCTIDRAPSDATTATTLLNLTRPDSNITQSP